MYGPEGKYNAKEMGVVPRSISALLQSIEDNDSIESWTMKVSCLEIYLEQMRDLLVINKKKKKTSNNKSKKTKSTKSKKDKIYHNNGDLRIRTLPNGRTIIQNLYEEEVETLMEVLSLIQKASKNRTTSSHNMNATSSRSHLVMICHLEQKMQDGSTKISTLNFADLGIYINYNIS